MFSTISRICKWFEPEIVDITVQDSQSILQSRVKILPITVWAKRRHPQYKPKEMPLGMADDGCL